jgi:hypothetical protein
MEPHQGCSLEHANKFAFVMAKQVNRRESHRLRLRRIVKMQNLRGWVKKASPVFTLLASSPATLEKKRSIGDCAKSVLSASRYSAACTLR